MKPVDLDNNGPLPLLRICTPKGTWLSSLALLHGFNHATNILMRSLNERY